MRSPPSQRHQVLPLTTVRLVATARLNNSTSPPKPKPLRSVKCCIAEIGAMLPPCRQASFPRASHDGSFSRADFVFDPARNIYVCPGGAERTSTGNIDQGPIGYYRPARTTARHAR